MPNKNEAITILIKGLQTEQFELFSYLQDFLEKLRKSDIDYMIKSDVENNIALLVYDTSVHAKLLTEMLRNVAQGEDREY